MKTNMKRVLALWLTGLAICVVVTSCGKKDTSSGITPADVTAAEKAAAEKALADKAAADKAAADKAAADKAAADKNAADMAAAEKAAADKALADKAAADQIAADMAAAEKAAADSAAAAKAAADKAAADEKAHAATLPTELVVMKSELAQTLSQIDVTVARLEVLSVSTDIKQPSKDAIASIDLLDTLTQAVQKRAQDMRDRGASYFNAWEEQLKSVSTPEVAAIAAQRRDELATGYADVLTSMQESRAAFDPFWTEMQSIRKVVDDGLTPQGQMAFAAQVKSVKEMAATLRSRVEATSAKLNQVSVIYTRP